MTTRSICSHDSSLASVMKYAKIILIAGDVNVVIGSVIFLIGILIVSVNIIYFIDLV